MSNEFDITADDRRLQEAFMLLTPKERQLLTAALAGNHPGYLDHLRKPVIRGLVLADVRAPIGPTRLPAAASMEERT